MRITLAQRSAAAFKINGAALLIAMSVISVWAAPAAAETPTLTAQMRGSLDDKIDMKLTGRLDGRCLISGGRSINFGELRGGEGAKAVFGLDCNVPFDIDIRSARGGLAHVAQPHGEGPFSGLLEYDLSLTVPTLRPTPALMRANFSSRQLLAKRSLSSGEGIASGGGILEFRMRNADGAGLLAGDYSETLSLTVSPRI